MTSTILTPLRPYTAKTSYVLSIVNWVIAIVGRKMALDLHRIMEYAADPNQTGFQHTVE